MKAKMSERVKYINNSLCVLDKLYQALLIKNNVSDSIYVVLFAIMELGEGCTQKDISDTSSLSKKTVNTTIKKLESEGILKLKAGKYPTMHIHLTKAGSEYIKKKIIPIIDLENEVMKNMTETEFQVFSASNNKYIEIFKREVEKFLKVK